MQSRDRSELLGSMPMSRLVPKVSIPIMFSMLIQALYNVVDSIFVSRFDPNGLTAVSLAAPFQFLMIAHQGTDTCILTCHQHLQVRM